jgi:hypothetical protein
MEQIEKQVDELIKSGIEFCKKEMKEKQVLILTRDILKRLKILGREAFNNETFTDSWINDLNKIKKDLDEKIEIMDIYDEEILGEYSEFDGLKLLFDE